MHKSIVLLMNAFNLVVFKSDLFIEEVKHCWTQVLNV